MEEITVHHQSGRLTAVSDTGKTMGYITFPQIRRGLVNIDRLQIIPEFRDMGVEGALMDALLIHLHRQGSRAALTSPAVQRHAASDPRWKEILPESMHMTSH